MRVLMNTWRTTVMATTEWQPIETAPRDGTRFQAKSISKLIVAGRRPVIKRVTWWGKASHVPLYGWCHGRGENVDLWQPTQWAPIPDSPEGE